MAEMKVDVTDLKSGVTTLQLNLPLICRHGYCFPYPKCQYGLYAVGFYEEIEGLSFLFPCLTLLLYVRSEQSFFHEMYGLCDDRVLPPSYSLSVT